MYSLNQLDRETETAPKLITISQEMSASLWKEREREQAFERRPLICAKLISNSLAHAPLIRMLYIPRHCKMV